MTKTVQTGKTKKVYDTQNEIVKRICFEMQRVISQVHGLHTTIYYPVLA